MIIFLNFYNPMSLADSIIAAIEKDESNEFDTLRSQMKSKKSLSKTDFMKLVEIIRKQTIEILSTEDLTVKEYEFIGKAMMAAKLNNVDDIIKFIIKNNGNRAALLLNCVLNKKCKINPSPLNEYLEMMVTEEMHLCHLKLLFTVSKNYPNLISNKILDYCSENQHPICKEIIKRHRVEIE